MDRCNFEGCQSLERTWIHVIGLTKANVARRKFVLFLMFFTVLPQQRFLAQVMCFIVQVRIQSPGSINLIGREHAEIPYHCLPPGQRQFITVLCLLGIVLFGPNQALLKGYTDTFWCESVKLVYLGHIHMESTKLKVIKFSTNFRFFSFFHYQNCNLRIIFNSFSFQTNRHRRDSVSGNKSARN